MAQTFSLDPATLEGRIGQQIMKAMQDEINAVAEPIMARALEEIQAKMKQRLGSVTIGLMSRGFSLERFGDELRIVVQVKDPQV